MARRPDVPCAGNCGKKMWKGSGSLVPGKAMCRPCRAARQKTKAGICSICNAAFSVVAAAGSGRLRATCSDACATVARFRQRPTGYRTTPRDCEICGSGFLRTYPGQRTCGRTCGAILKARNRPAPAPALPAPPVISPPVISTCRVCLVEVRASRALMYCSKKCTDDWHNAKARKLPSEMQCAECGQGFRGTPRRRFCSRTCGRKFNKREWKTPANHRKRAREYGVPYEPVKPGYIFERDRWFCGICCKRISRKAKFPDLMSASLDHVIPLSLGPGVSPGHVVANLQAAHFLCNSRKSAGVAGAGEQLALVG